MAPRLTGISVVGMVLALPMLGCGGPLETASASPSPLEGPELASQEAPLTRTNIRFGTMCQRAYEGHWQHELPYTWNRCAGFNNRLDNTDSKIFYYNLVNAESFWETPYDQRFLDNVEIFYSSTHGGAWTGQAVWAMWNRDSLASSSQMRLGDESYGLSILSTYACETLKTSGLISRWHPVMKGGLRYVTGSHGSLYDSWSTDEVGEDYAYELQHGASIRYAWRDGVSDWNTKQDAAVMTTGKSASDCSYRRSAMRKNNFTSFPELRDGDIRYYCWTTWDNL